MKRKAADQLCSRCDKPGFRYRGERWLCVVHNRFDTMRASAQSKGKIVPTHEQLEEMASILIARGMKCEACGIETQWAGVKGSLSTISLQHDRCGKLRLICMGCNQRHDDLPGDTFYDLPANHWPCPKCKRMLHLSAYYRERAGVYCKDCRKEINREKWAVHGKRYMENSLERKRHANH